MDFQEDISHSPLLVAPIGFIRSPHRAKFDAPHQPARDGEEVNRIELLPHFQFEQAVEDLIGFDRIWIIWWFHRNSRWKPKVRPPRGSAKKRGVFATRSPHRPNPIGITAARLCGIRGRNLLVGPCDLVDGTPILDIKPYIPEVDSFPQSQVGWIASLPDPASRGGKYEVIEGPLAKAQAKWLVESWGIDFLTRARAILSQDPSPHRTRRITPHGEGFRMGCGPWRILFTLQGTVVTITQITPGYPLSYLQDPLKTRIIDREAQEAFMFRWGQPGGPANPPHNVRQDQE